MIRFDPQPLLLILLLLPLAVTTGCNQFNAPAAEQGTNDSSQPAKLKVVATFLPLYWFTKAVAGESAEVKILIPPGTEVHEYQSNPADVGAIAQTRALVKNGLGLEAFLADTVRSAENPQLKVIDASQNIQPLQAISPVVQPGKRQQSPDSEPHPQAAKSGETPDPHSHESGNPHVWLDPVLAAQQVETIRDGLIAVDPQNKAIYQANAATYIQQLKVLDNQFKQSLQRYPQCTLVTFHDAFPYLAKRYQLKQVAVVELPEDNLSPADVQKAVATVKQYNVKALFGEPGVDNKLLQSLSRDLNLNLRTLDSLESGPLDPQHYFTAMKANLQALESACQ